MSEHTCSTSLDRYEDKDGNELDESMHLSEEDTASTSRNWSMTALSSRWLCRVARYSRLTDYQESEDMPGMSSVWKQQELDGRLRSVWRWRCTTALLATALAVVGIAHLLPSAPSDVTSSVVHDVHMRCGNTTHSARSRGCQFHPLSNSWLPGRCRLEHAEEAFAAALNVGSSKVPFKAWLDPAGESEITDWSGLEVGTLVWTTQSHHISHCLSMLVQAAAVLEFGDMAEETARDWAHTTYCVQTILTATRSLEGWNQINSFFPIGSGTCW